jgi:hypothetical protein
VAEVLAGLDDEAVQRGAPEAPSCLSLVREFVAASERLGQVAHDVLGHVPAGGAYPERATAPSAAELQAHLRFLRDHIVSTIEQQGVAVWFRTSAEGRPLCAFAVDLAERDKELLVALKAAAHAQRGLPGQMNDRA